MRDFIERICPCCKTEIKERDSVSGFYTKKVRKKLLAILSSAALCLLAVGLTSCSGSALDAVSASSRMSSATDTNGVSSTTEVSSTAASADAGTNESGSQTDMGIRLNQL